MYTHITSEERALIAYYHLRQVSIKDIAHLLKRPYNTIWRELKRNSKGKGARNGSYNYQVKHAEKQVKERQKHKFNASISTPELIEEIEDKLALGWNPEQIVEKARIEEQRPDFVSPSTIYRWIKKKMLWNGDHQVLRRKGKKKKTKNRSPLTAGKRSIEERPESANLRLEKGHWEADTIGSGKDNVAIVTLVDRYSRFLVAARVENRQSETVAKAISRALASHDVKTITFDNGTEFAKFAKLEKRFKCLTYFAHPHSPWERGSNENANGLLREYFPKGESIAPRTNKEVNLAVDAINHRPKLIFRGKSPAQIH